MSILCPKCATENGDGAKFCKACGQKLSPLPVSLPPDPIVGIACPSCSKENSAGAKFCKSCGGSMSPAPAPAPATAIPPSDNPKGPKKSATETPQAPVAEVEKGTNYALVGGIAFVCLALLGAGAYWYLGKSVQPTASPAVAASAPLPIAPSAMPASAPIAVPVSEPEPAPIPPVSVPAADPVPTPVPVATQAKPLKKPVEKKLDLPTKPTPAPIYIPAAPAPVAQPVKPVVPSRPSSPEEACGKRVFIALTMCINEQCDKPQFTNHPQCVKFRQQTKDTLERMYSR